MNTKQNVPNTRISRRRERRAAAFRLCRSTAPHLVDAPRTKGARGPAGDVGGFFYLTHTFLLRYATSGFLNNSRDRSKEKVSNWHRGFVPVGDARIRDVCSARGSSFVRGNADFVGYLEMRTNHSRSLCYSQGEAHQNGLREAASYGGAPHAISA